MHNAHYASTNKLIIITILISKHIFHIFTTKTSILKTNDQVFEEREKGAPANMEKNHVWTRTKVVI